MTTGFHWCVLYEIEMIESKGWSSLSNFHTEKISEEEFQNRLLKSCYIS